MSIEWYENDGLITCLAGGKMTEPFMYILAENPPPWKVENLDGTLNEFDSLEAAQLSLIIRLGDQHD